MLRIGSAGVIDANSAGLLFDGREASDGAIAWGDEAGLDLRMHRSRVISRPVIEAADFVFGMEPRHVREVVAMVDDAWTKTYTLREFAKRVSEVDRRGDAEPFASWLERLGHGRVRRDLLVDAADLTIPDPYGRSFEVYARTAALIEACLVRIAARGWPNGIADLDGELADAANEDSLRSA